MKALLTLKSVGVSFAHDPGALACLLHEITRLATQSSGEVLIDAVGQAAKGLGYQGPVSGVRRLLIAKGFLSEAQKGKQFFLHDVNHEAIQNFFKEHEALLVSKRLSDIERISIFGSEGVGGTKAEDVLVRVMKALSVLLEELSDLSSLEKNVRLTMAEHETVRFIAVERVQWCTERMNTFYSEADAIRSSCDVHDRMRFQQLAIKYANAYNEFISVVDAAQTESEQVDVLVHDYEIVHLLKAFREFLIRFSDIFLRKEEGIN